MRLAVFLLSLSALAAAQEYFPLQVGNQWVYRPTGRVAGDPQVVEAVQAGQFGGRTYTQLRGWFGSVWVRTAEDGSLYAYDAAGGTEKLWTSFGQAPFTSGVPPCDQPARVVSTAARYSGPIGSFSNALQIDYSAGGCADAGLEQDLYLPWVGLVQRRTTTIAGPVTYDLVYARLGVTEISAPERAFTVGLDQAVYSGNRMLARLTVRNTHSTPLRLDFSSSQRYDFAIRDEKGSTVYTWSADKLFLAVMGSESISGQKTWTLVIPLDQIPAGTYTAEGWLTSTGPKYAASAGFRVVR